jgi:hypothetical protein
VAWSWRWFVRLAEKGKDATRFASTLAMFAARGAGWPAAHRHGTAPGRAVAAGPAAAPVHVCLLSDGSRLRGNVLEEALHDNTLTPVLYQVIFRLDFPRWRRTRTERDRRLLHDLMVGERTGAVSQKYGLSPSRVGQLRRELHADWDRFCASAADGR